MSFLPKSLKSFLKILFVGTNKENNEKKQASLGQALVQASSPRELVVPLQIVLAIQMHHYFGSSFLLNSLHQHGFCSSYTEVQIFEKNAAIVTDPVTCGRFVQYISVPL